MKNVKNEDTLSMKYLATFAVNINDIEIPVEIQFLTKDERQSCYRRNISHLIYNIYSLWVLKEDNS